MHGVCSVNVKHPGYYWLCTCIGICIGICCLHNVNESCLQHSCLYSSFSLADGFIPTEFSWSLSSAPCAAFPPILPIWTWGNDMLSSYLPQQWHLGVCRHFWCDQYHYQEREIFWSSNSVSVFSLCPASGGDKESSTNVVRWLGSLLPPGIQIGQTVTGRCWKWPE